MLPSVAATAVWGQGSSTVVVTGTKRVLVRRGPGTGFPPFAALTNGSAVEVLEMRGVSSEKIELLPSVCTSTLDEAHALADYLDRSPDLRVAVVTNTFHTRRTRLLFSRVLGRRAGLVTFISAPTDCFSAQDWWHHEEGLVTYSTEYVKLLQALVR